MLKGGDASGMDYEAKCMALVAAAVGMLGASRYDVTLNLSFFF